MRDNEQTLKIELLSQWKLEAEFRNISRQLEWLPMREAPSKKVAFPPLNPFQPVYVSNSIRIFPRVGCSGVRIF